MATVPTSSSGGLSDSDNKNNDSQYYSQGSTELATETPVTIKKLETRRQLTKNSTRIVIALVGLPARGKSFVARKLESYLNWGGCKCKIFNVGRYRREAYANLQQETTTTTETAESEVREGEEKGGSGGVNRQQSHRIQTGACDANFFDASNQTAALLREKVAETALIDMLKWLDAEDEYAEESTFDDLEAHASLHSLTTQSSNISTGSPTVPAPRLDFHRHERIAIFDATNSTDKRRHWVLEQCTSPVTRQDKPTGVVFVESICDDQELLEENYRFKIKNSPDFDSMGADEALQDLRNRVRKYEEQYETILDDSLSYIKVFNLSTKLLCNHIYGRMAKELVPALMAWHIGTRPVFLCRPGQTISGIWTDGEDYVAKAKIDTTDPRFLDMSTKTRRKNFRGDSLGSSGKSFREELLDYCYDEAHSFMFERASVRDMAYTGTSISGLAASDALITGSDGANMNDHKDPFPLRILTSTMERAIETVNWQEFKFKTNTMSNLNPLDKGDFAGMELDEIRRINPTWYDKLEKNPFDTRFPGGESYRDLIRRITSVVIDVEQQVIPTLVVSHVSILQCLIAYFRNSPIEKCMSIEVPMHTVVKFTPVRGGGWKESRIQLCDVEGLPSSLSDNNNNEVPAPPPPPAAVTPPMANSSSSNKVSAATGVGNASTTTTTTTTTKTRSIGFMPQVESSSEISTLSADGGDTSPIWGDHVLRAQKGLVKGTT